MEKLSYKAVIGLGFGDEGKGNFTNYLCCKSRNSLVIRFSGGHQAGHTVVYQNKKHVFSNFGSGTLVGTPTYWSKFCTFEPIDFLNEFGKLKKLKIDPLIYIDERCPMTTPYDKYWNRVSETTDCYGSCGLGFGTTLEREKRYYSLTFLDLFYPEILKIKLDNIKKYYYKIEIDLSGFLESCKAIRQLKNVKIVCGLPKDYSNYIFEGSQGLMLDQHYGFFPNVTRSNTGTKNILKMIDEKLEVFLITRAYQTRHGNGVMTNENFKHNIKINPTETNTFNKHQGNFRRTLLDVSLLEYAIKKDKYILNCKNKNLVITCIDHIKNECRFTYKNEIINCINKIEFIRKISEILEINNVYINDSEDSKEILKFESDDRIE